jgi:hypothetical protein
MCLLQTELLKASRSSSKLVMSMLCAFTRASSALYVSAFRAALRKTVIMGMKNCGRTTYIFGYRCETSTIAVLTS